MKKKAKVISGGTETHLLVIDTKTSYNLTGKEAAEILEKVGIICNKQMIPYDTEKPSTSSGIRLGSPALTSWGFGKKEFLEIVEIINLSLENYQNDNIKKEMRNKVKILVKKLLHNTNA